MNHNKTPDTSAECLSATSWKDLEARVKKTSTNLWLDKDIQGKDDSIPEYMTSSSLGAYRREKSTKRNSPTKDIEAGAPPERILNYLTLAQTNELSMLDYSTVDYPKELEYLETYEQYYITAINTTSPSKLQTNSTNSPVSSVFSPVSSFPTKLQDGSQLKLGKANQFRAFSRHAYSYTKRQWFTNICCVSLCPVFIIILSFLIQSLLQGLLLTSVDQNYQVLYCSDQPSINQQQWPIYNTKAAGINEKPASSYRGATKTVKHFNFLQRAIYVDLSSADGLNVYSALSLTGSAPCNISIS
jgi:hypothetical protein